MKIYYNSKLKEYAKTLRNRATPAEKKLWRYLRNKTQDYDFHRQKPIGNYIADFYCPELKLIIEIDGYSHEEKWHKDLKRQKELEDMGFKILRFKEKEVIRQIEGVITIIGSFIEEIENTTHPRKS